MPSEPDVLAELVSRGGDLNELRNAGNAQLQQALKDLGYAKLGERAKVVTAIKNSVASQPAASQALDAGTSSTADEVSDKTVVMHGAVNDIFDDGGLLKTTLRAGDRGTTPPPLLSKVKVRYIASVLPECRRFEAVVKEIHLGEKEVPRGLEKCISTSERATTVPMKPVRARCQSAHEPGLSPLSARPCAPTPPLAVLRGETCELIARAEYAYGNDGREPDVAPGSSIRYEVELISVTPPKKERSELTPHELAEAAAELKAKGTSAFASGLWLEAQVHYHEASRLLLTEWDEVSRSSHRPFTPHRATHLDAAPAYRGHPPPFTHAGRLVDECTLTSARRPDAPRPSHPGLHTPADHTRPHSPGRALPFTFTGHPSERARGGDASAARHVPAQLGAVRTEARGVVRGGQGLHRRD